MCSDILLHEVTHNILVIILQILTFSKDNDYTSFLSCPFSKVIVFIVSHFSHFAPKSDIFQKACGVR
jgi:hypothetical protein